MASEQMVIVGGGLASFHAVKELRHQGISWPITVVTDEPSRPADRPPLTKGFLTGTLSDEETDFAWDGLDINWMLQSRAQGVDAESRQVLISSGELPYTHLLIATGVSPRAPEGLAGQSYSVVHNAEESRRLRDQLTAGSELLVLGGGFIAVEVASSARELGVNVTLVSRRRPMEKYGPHVADYVESLLEKEGVVVFSPDRVVETTSDQGTVLLHSGAELHSDTIVVALGSQPNTHWLYGSSIPIDDGILCGPTGLVDGVDGIASAGDVARWRRASDGVHMPRQEHWTNAVQQGRIAAQALAGLPVSAPGPGSFWSDHFGQRLQGVGSPELGHKWEILTGSPGSGKFVSVATKDGKVVGATGYGMPREIAEVSRGLTRSNNLIGAS